MKINKTDNYIEVIGHYDNAIQCAKMTLLADLYAIEHRSGYAKFPLSVEDKLKRVDERLEFVAYSVYVYGLGLTEPIYAFGGKSLDSLTYEAEIGTKGTSEQIYVGGVGSQPDYVVLSSSSSSYIPITNYKITNATVSAGTVEVIDDTTILANTTNGIITLTVEAVQPQPSINYEYKQLATKEDLDSKLDNSKQAIASKGGLVTPSAVLSSNELVGVGTNGEQIRVQLGEGLTLEGTGSPYTLKASGGGGGGYKVQFGSIASNRIPTIYFSDGTSTEAQSNTEYNNVVSIFFVFGTGIDIGWDSSIPLLKVITIKHVGYMAGGTLPAVDGAYITANVTVSVSDMTMELYNDINISRVFDDD